MKKVIFSLILFLSGVFVVSAEEIYFTNYYGDSLTKSEYNYLINYFDKESLYTMNSNLFNDVKESNGIEVKKEERYVKVDTYYDYAGNVLRNLETEVSESEALSFKSSNISTRATTATHKTSMKKITLRIYLVEGQVYAVVNLVNEWLGIPAVKSIDLIGVRIMSDSPQVDYIRGHSNATQTWDGNVIAYNVCNNSTSCPNAKVTEASNYTGVGVSMNLKDNVSSTLRNELTVAVSIPEDYIIAVGTYQHATKTVSLSDSKGYSFSASGLGNVFYFNGLLDDTEDSYDNTAGLTVRYDF